MIIKVCVFAFLGNELLPLESSKILFIILKDSFPTDSIFITSLIFWQKSASKESVFAKKCQKLIFEQTVFFVSNSNIENNFWPIFVNKFSKYCQLEINYYPLNPLKWANFWKIFKFKMGSRHLILSKYTIKFESN